MKIENQNQLAIKKTYAHQPLAHRSIYDGPTHRRDEFQPNRFADAIA